MKKRFLFTLVATILFLSIAISSFAMGNIANDVRNFVGGTENTIENVGNNVAGGIKNGFNTVEHGAENVASDMKSGAQKAGNSVMGMTTNNNNGGYTATRTSGNAAIAGMSTNTWTWIIVGITAAAIVILVW